MTSRGKTDLQRRILLTWYDNPGATRKEIADACDCSASYVSQVLNRFDNYDEFAAMMDRQDAQLERMFGDDVFARSPNVNTAIEGPGLAETYDELPDNPVGNLLRLLILLVVLFVFYEVVSALLPLL